MDRVQALSQLDHRVGNLAHHFSGRIYSIGPSAGWTRWQRLGSVQPSDWHRQLSGLYRDRHNGVDVAKRRAVECGLCAAQRSTARHTGNKLDVADMALFVLARQ